MTPPEQIAYLRSHFVNDHFEPYILAVCDLAERALALETAAREVVRMADLREGFRYPLTEHMAAVSALRALLADNCEENQWT